MCHPVEEGPTSAAGPSAAEWMHSIPWGHPEFRAARPPISSSVGPICSLENGDGVFCLSEGRHDPEQTRTLLRPSAGQETVYDLQRKHARERLDRILQKKVVGKNISIPGLTLLIHMIYGV